MRHARGFTLLEVLVALVIVAFGMSAVLSALSSSADNIASLRDKTLAQWIAMNQIADARLNLNAPLTGVSEGDVKNFGGSDWHWRQDVMAVNMIPGMLEIAVRVRRIVPGSSSSKSSSSSGARAASSNASRGSGISGASGASSSGAPGSFFSSSGGLGSSGTGALGPGTLGLNSSSGMVNRNIGATKLPATGDNQQWVATAIGFRGDAVSVASGEAPDWQACNQASTTNGVNAAGASSLCNSSSGGDASSSSSGTVASPNVNGTGSSQTTSSSSSGSNAP